MKLFMSSAAREALPDLSLRLKRLIRQLWTVLSIVWTALEIPRENVSIINHTEAYLYFVLRQAKGDFEIEPCFRLVWNSA